MQDPRRKHFLGRLPRLQPHYEGATALEHLDRSSPVFATFTNAAPVYVEQLLNWAYHLRDLNLPHVVVCLDPESEDIAKTNGLPWVPVDNQTTSEDVRNDHATFRAMVSRKVRVDMCSLTSVAVHCRLRCNAMVSRKVRVNKCSLTREQRLNL